MEVCSLRVYGDSQLIVRQVNRVYEVCKPKLMPYYLAAWKLIEKFKHIEVLHVLEARMRGRTPWRSLLQRLCRGHAPLAACSSTSTRVQTAESGDRKFFLPYVF
jgi:hypothetical protein